MKIREQIRRMVKEAIAEYDFSEAVAQALTHINIGYLVEKKIERDLDLTDVVEELVEEIVDEEIDYIDVDDILDD